MLLLALLGLLFSNLLSCISVTFNELLIWVWQQQLQTQRLRAKSFGKNKTLKLTFAVYTYRVIVFYREFRLNRQLQIRRFIQLTSIAAYFFNECVYWRRHRSIKNRRLTGNSINQCYIRSIPAAVKSLNSVRKQLVCLVWILI